MNTALVMLGSNIDAENNLNQAKEKLSLHFEIVKESSVALSKPHGKQYKSDFLNKAIMLYTDDNQKEIISIFKDIEIELGRTQASKFQGLVPIDIDLIFWNEILINQDYERFDFVKTCINEII